MKLETPTKILILMILLSLTFSLKQARATGGTGLYMDPTVSFGMTGDTFTVDIAVADVEFPATEDVPEEEPERRSFVAEDTND